MNKLKLLFISLIIVVVSNINAQNITQSVRGQIIEKQTQATLPGATVILLESNPVIATITDNNGYFLLENIPIGRISLQISFIGFNTIILSNLNLLAGKEFELSSNKGKTKYKKVITIDGKFTWAGGLRYTLVDIKASIENGQTELDQTKPFSEQFDDYIRPDIRIAFRLDGKKTSQELAFDIQNFIDTNRTA